MISAACSCCGCPADRHHPAYADGSGWFCNDCYPVSRRRPIEIVNEWQAAWAETWEARRLRPRAGAKVIPFPKRMRGAA